MAFHWTPDDMPELHGKVAVVTGANSGIGFETVRVLALKGAKVYFTTRSEDKAKATQAKHLKLNPNLSPDSIPFLVMELEDLRSVANAAETLRAKEEKVDILVNNAGGVLDRLEFTEYGWEREIALSHTGHFVFVNGVLPLMKKATTYPGADVRVVTLASNASRMVIPANYPIDFSDSSLFYGKTPYEPWLYRNVFKRFIMAKDMFHYAIAKLANAMFARELQKRLDQHGVPILSISVHPGGVRSEEVHTVFKGFLGPLIASSMLPVEVGTHTSLFAATAKEVREKPEVYKGNYLEPGTVHPGHRALSDPAQTKALWETTERELNQYFAKKGFNPLLPW